MKKIITTLLIVTCIWTMSYAQDYKTGIGLRGGFFNGITVKHFISSNRALEGLINTRWRGFELTGLYEIHHQAFNTARLKWYYGFGAHVGSWNGNNTNWGKYGTNYTVVGIDGILGIEYSFTEIPFNIGLDWKPTINLIGYTGFWGDGGAISLRYIF